MAKRAASVLWNHFVSEEEQNQDERVQLYRCVCLCPYVIVCMVHVIVTMTIEHSSDLHSYHDYPYVIVCMVHISVTMTIEHSSDSHSLDTRLISSHVNYM